MKSTGRGSFRGVPFLVYKEQRTRGGRRVVRREYPLRENGGADDLGRKLPEHTLTLSLVGDDAQAQRERLTQALNAPGPGELNHPDLGTLSVLVDNFESRYSVDNLRLVEFTLTVVPVADETAPTVATDTAGRLATLGNGTLDDIFNTLSEGWSLAEAGLSDVQALMDTVSEKVAALESAVNGVGILADISSFVASFTAMRGNLSSLLTTPARLAQAFKGIYQGLLRLPAYPQPDAPTAGTRTASTTAASTLPAGITPQRGASSSFAPSQTQWQIALQRQTLLQADRLDRVFKSQDSARDVDGLQADTRRNIQLLQNTVSLAATLIQVQIVSSLLTVSIEQTRIQQRRTAKPQTDTGRDMATTRLTVPGLESADDVTRISKQCADRLERGALTTSAQGHMRLAITLRAVRRALVDDLSRRGVALPGIKAVETTTTEPALVTLYRTAGDAQDYARFIRRNHLAHPLFVPGGTTVEIING